MTARIRGGDFRARQLTFEFNPAITLNIYLCVLRILGEQLRRTMSTISKAIRDLEEQRRRIDSALKVLRGLDHGGSGGGSRNISEEGRNRIAEAQRRRWAKVRAAKAAAGKK